MKRNWLIVYDSAHKKIVRFGHGDLHHLETFELGPFATDNGFSLINITDQMESIDKKYTEVDITLLPNTKLIEQLGSNARFDGTTLYIKTSKLIIDYNGDTNIRKPVTLADDPIVFTIKKVDLNGSLLSSAVDTISVEASLGSLDLASKELINGEITFTLTLPTVTVFPQMVKVSIYSNDMTCGIEDTFFNITS